MNSSFFSFKGVLCATLCTVALFATGCSNKKNKSTDEISDSSKQISIVTTIFAPYDFARAVAKNTSTTVTMLLPPGAEVHSWEPTAHDMITIQNAALFIYAGGEGDVWADKLVASLDKPISSIRMTDCVKLFEEEHPEGMEPEHDDAADEKDTGSAQSADEVEWDEHVWTSPKNAMLIVQKIADTLCSIDEKNSNVYKKNAAAYLTQLEHLDNEFTTVVNSAKRKTVVFADRFPARYFTEEFGLSYYAAFPGCSTDTEPSAKTVAFIINKVKEEKIPAVFYIELSNQKMADTVCEATGCHKLLFNSCHNLSKKEFELGTTYLDVMKQNVQTLKEALN